MNNEIINNIIREKIPCFFISPHLDDAALSAGGLIAHLSRHTHVQVINVFTKVSPKPYTLSAKAFLRQCGYPNDADALFDTRVKEDARAYATIDITPRHLGFEDALCRRLPTLSPVRRVLSRILPEFAHIYPVFRTHIAGGRVSQHDAGIVQKLGEELRGIVGKHERYYIFCPLAIKTHVDHVLVRDVCLDNFQNVLLWSDFPYSMANGISPENAGTFAQLAFTWEDNMDEKKRMVSEYKSQLRALFPYGIPALPLELYYLSKREHTTARTDGGDAARKRATVSVAVPAYNEGSNIRRLLNTVLAQAGENFSLEEVIVISDGSTDNTVREARSISSEKIRLIDSPRRQGKSKHLNTIFKMAKGDIVVLFDADVLLSDRNVIANLIRPIVQNSKVGLVGGNPQPVPAMTFIEKGVNATFNVYDKLRTELHGGNNAFGCDGRILALSKSFASHVTVPDTMIANDAFLYFSCLKEGFLFNHERTAVVLFKSPTNMRDQLRQNKRFIAAHYRLERIFGDIVRESYTVPKGSLYALLLREFLKAPFSSFVVFLINRYCGYRAKREERSMTAKWSMAISTKNI